MSEANAMGAQPIDVNAASVEMLRDRVSGLGQVLAERIVAYREAQGGFKDLEELTRVQGIGPVLLQKIRHQLVVTPVAASRELSAPLEAAEEPSGEEERALPHMDVSPAEDLGVTRRLTAMHDTTGGDQEGKIVGEAGPSAVAPEEVSAERGEQAEQASERVAMVVPNALAEEGMEESMSTERASATEMGDAEQEAAGGEALTMEAEAVRGGVPPHVAPAAAAAERSAPRGGFWRSALLVLLGGCAGVILTLVVLMIWAGTLDFAPRRDVNALSRNLNTMQANQELAWERIDQLTVRLGDAERAVRRLEALSERVANLEQGLGDAEAEVAALSADLVTLQDRVVTVDRSLETLGQRLGQTEAGLQELSGSLQALQDAFDAVQERVMRFDSFLSSLRDLLIDIQGLPVAETSVPTEGTPTEAESAVEATPEQTAPAAETPVPTPTATPVVTPTARP